MALKSSIRALAKHSTDLEGQMKMFAQIAAKKKKQKKINRVEKKTTMREMVYTLKAYALGKLDF